MSKKQRGLQRPRERHAVAWDYVMKKGNDYLCVLCFAKGVTSVLGAESNMVNNLPILIGKHLVRKHEATLGRTFEKISAWCKAASQPTFNGVVASHAGAKGTISNMFTNANKAALEKTKDLIVRLIIMCNLPFNIVTKESFQKLLKHVYSPFPKLRMTSRATVTARLARIAQASHDRVRDFIAHTSFVSLSADEWASRKSMTPYLSVTAYFVVDHHVEIRLLALVPLEEDSTASSMAGAIESVLVDYACLEKALSLTTDGAGSMMAITDASTVKDCPDITSLVHSRCLVHLLNLVLKSSSTKTTGVTVDDPEKAAFANPEETVVTDALDCVRGVAKHIHLSSVAARGVRVSQGDRRKVDGVRRLSNFSGAAEGFEETGYEMDAAIAREASTASSSTASSSTASISSSEVDEDAAADADFIMLDDAISGEEAVGVDYDAPSLGSVVGSVPSTNAAVPTGRIKRIRLWIASRWSSNIQMVQRFLLLFRYVAAVMSCVNLRRAKTPKKTPVIPMPSPDQLSLLRAYILIIAPAYGFLLHLQQSSNLTPYVCDRFVAVLDIYCQDDYCPGSLTSQGIQGQPPWNTMREVGTLVDSVNLAIRSSADLPSESEFHVDSDVSDLFTMSFDALESAHPGLSAVRSLIKQDLEKALDFMSTTPDPPKRGYYVPGLASALCVPTTISAEWKTHVFDVFKSMIARELWAEKKGLMDQRKEALTSLLTSQKRKRTSSGTLDIDDETITIEDGEEGEELVPGVGSSSAATRVRSRGMTPTRVNPAMQTVAATRVRSPTGTMREVRLNETPEEKVDRRYEEAVAEAEERNREQTKLVALSLEKFHLSAESMKNAKELTVKLEVKKRELEEWLENRHGGREEPSSIQDFLDEHRLGRAGRGMDRRAKVLAKGILELEVEIGVLRSNCGLMQKAIEAQQRIFDVLPEAPGWDVMTAFWSLIADPLVDLQKLGGDELKDLIPMAKYAVGIMGIPVCSVVDERIFSAAALVFTPWRQLLDLKRGSDLLTTRTNEAFRKRSTPSGDQAATWDAFLLSILKTP